MRHAVILAGGSGTRLWPASRRANPKQLLPFGEGGASLLADTVARGRAVAGERVAIVTGEDQRDATAAAAPGIELIVEPAGRNTAPAIGLAAATIAARDRDATLVVLPADHRVADPRGLVRVIERGLAEVERDDVIGTVGIPPTRPETGFGYLEVARATLGAVVPVLRFVEKPDRATAERYLAGGTHLWNAGIVLARAQRILDELDVRAPDIARAVRAIAAGTAAAAEVYPALPAISFDHAVMEHAARVVAIPAAVGWDDVGSWAAVAELLAAAGDAAGNAIAGEAVVLDGSGNLVISDGPLIAAIGVSDLVIVKAGDAILVLPRHAAQRVREVIDALAARGLDRYL